MRQVVPDTQNNITESGNACGRFVYENGKLSYIIHSDGLVRAVYNTPGGGSVQINPEMGITITPADGGEVLSGFTREIHLKDHLGNVRAVFDYSKLQSENHYYPFGLPIHNLCTSTAPEGKENRYLYNGKELQDDLGLNWMDYGARFYDAGIGRFHSTDLLAEVFSYQSPYAYAVNNPIYYIDYMGLGPKQWWAKLKGWINVNLLGKTWNGNFKTVTPAKQARTVVYKQEHIINGCSTPTWRDLIIDDFIKGGSGGVNWDEPYTFKSSFDESYRSNIKGQGVKFSYPIPGRSVWLENHIGMRKTLLKPDDDYTIRVYADIRTFLGLNMGNRMHVSYQGKVIARPTFTPEDLEFMKVNKVTAFIYPIEYYQVVLRLYGTKEYFNELERAGIIEPLDTEKK